MRTAIKDALNELRQAREEQDLVTAARTETVHQYATTDQKVLQSTQHNLKSEE